MKRIPISPRFHVSFRAHISASTSCLNAANVYTAKPRAGGKGMRGETSTLFSSDKFKPHLNSTQTVVPCVFVCTTPPLLDLLAPRHVCTVLSDHFLVLQLRAQQHAFCEQYITFLRCSGPRTADTAWFYELVAPKKTSSRG